MTTLKLLTAAEVADILRLNRQVVLRKLQDGEIEAYKIGKEWRVDEAALRVWLQRHSNRRGLDERSRTLDSFFGPDGRLTSIPTRRLRRQVVLERLIAEFDPARTYTEREVNEVLRRFHEDVCTLRREFVMNGMMVRAKGVYRRCSSWRPVPAPRRERPGSRTRPSSMTKAAPAKGEGE